MNKLILYIAAIISIATYLFWSFFENSIFYKGNALFILLLCIYIFSKNKQSFICFFLLCISFNNFLDEMLFDPKIISSNEIIVTIILPIIWLIKNKRYARKIERKRHN